jgi:glutamate carboxypeptidase
MAIAEIALGVARDLSVSAGTISPGGVSDANVLQAAGLPCLDGLGVRGGNLHRIDEFVVTASLVERATILALLINRLLSRPFVTSSL